MDMSKILTNVLIIIFGIGLFVYLQSSIMALETSAWTFGGHDIVIAILPILPTIFLVCLIAIPIAIIAKEGLDDSS